MAFFLTESWRGQHCHYVAALAEIDYEKLFIEQRGITG